MFALLSLFLGTIFLLYSLDILTRALAMAMHNLEPTAPNDIPSVWPVLIPQDRQNPFFLIPDNMLRPLWLILYPLLSWIALNGSVFSSFKLHSLATAAEYHTNIHYSLF